MKDRNMYMYMHSWGEYTVLQELMTIEDFFVPLHLFRYLNRDIEYHLILRICIIFKLNIYSFH